MRFQDGAEVGSTILDRTRPVLGDAAFRDVSRAGDRAVVAAEEAGVVVVRPIEGAQFWHVPSARPALRVTVEGGFAYVACGDGGLAIIDLGCLTE